MEKNKKRITEALLLLLCVYGLWAAACRGQIHETPQAQKEDLSAYVGLQTADGLTENDYQTIFAQTGLTPLGMQTLIRQHRTGLLCEIQARFFEQPKLQVNRANIFCHQEWLAEPTAAEAEFVAEDGDIIITLASYLGGWRYGHCGLILDAQSGTVLEAVTYGQPSGKMRLSHWSEYPAFVILRPRGADEGTKREVIAYAERYLQDIPYDLFAFKYRTSYGPVKTTHCSHLVWYAYHSEGYDLDCDGTPVVTPYDLIHDDDLLLVQVYGMCLEGK